MGIKFSEIEDAFFFVSMAPMYSNQAILCKETGKIFYESAYGDEEEIPEEVYFQADCIKMIWNWDKTLYLTSLSSISQAILSVSGKYSTEKGHMEDTRIFSKAEGICKNGMTSRILGKQKLSENGVKITKSH